MQSLPRNVSNSGGSRFGWHSGPVQSPNRLAECLASLHGRHSCHDQGFFPKTPWGCGRVRGAKRCGSASDQPAYATLNPSTARPVGIVL